MPSQFSLSDYQDTIGALEGFIESHSCDANIIVGDFNIDFSRVSTSANYLSMFMASFDFVACDLAYSSSLSYTYERDDGTVRSWIDHILCSGSHCHLIGHFAPLFHH